MGPTRDRHTGLGGGCGFGVMGLEKMADCSGGFTLATLMHTPMLRLTLMIAVLLATRREVLGVACRREESCILISREITGGVKIINLSFDLKTASMS